MASEYLPVLERIGKQIKVIGKRERSLCHGPNPVFHATAVIAAVLPDGRLLLADKTEKQRRKRLQSGQPPLPEGTRIYDIFGGHMRYEDIPGREKEGFLSQDTYRKCAQRELSEELLLQKKDGSCIGFRPEPERFLPLGFYELSNDHNREYSWAFVYFLQDAGPYASQDTFWDSGLEEEIFQPVVPVSWDRLLNLFHGNSEKERVSDGVGRILSQGEAGKLHKLILQNCAK